MPYEVELQNMVSGISVESADKDETVKVIVRGFASDEKGQIFYSYLENMQNLFLQPYLAVGNHVSTIDHCLILMNKETNKATVYINELQILTTVIPKRAVKAGEPIIKEDIGGVVSLAFKDVSIPENNGIVFYFSIDWKRGIFFDFRPNFSDVKLEAIDTQLAMFYEDLLFYELRIIDHITWEKLYGLGWFPFVSLIGNKVFTDYVVRVSEGKVVDTWENKLIEFFDHGKSIGVVERFKQLSFFTAHIQFLEAGIERYFAGDYISSINNVWPRIEGVLRHIFATGKKPTQSNMVDNLRDIVASQPLLPSIFFPDRFRDYLLEFYFKDFDLKAGKLNVSRHSIGHGVSDPATYSRKYALLGILILDQLSYYLMVRKPQP